MLMMLTFSSSLLCGNSGFICKFLEPHLISIGLNNVGLEVKYLNHQVFYLNHLLIIKLSLIIRRVSVFHRFSCSLCFCAGSRATSIPRGFSNSLFNFVLLLLKQRRYHGMTNNVGIFFSPLVALHPLGY